MLPCWLNINHARVISLGCRFVKEVRNPTRGVLLYCDFDMLCKKCCGGWYRLCKLECIEIAGTPNLCIRGVGGRPRLPENFVVIHNRYAYSGTRYVVSALCFGFVFAVAFKARRRRNAAKSAYYCFRIHKVFLTLSAHNRLMAATAKCKA